MKLLFLEGLDDIDMLIFPTNEPAKIHASHYIYLLYIAKMLFGRLIK